MFSYPDAHRYRVGPNYFQLPPNRPHNPVYAPYVRDGPGTMNGNYGGDPDYVFSELRPMTFSKRVTMPTHEQFAGQVTSFATSVTDKDFEQARDLWHIIEKEDGGKDRFLHSIVPTLEDIPKNLQNEVIGKSPTLVISQISAQVELTRDRVPGSCRWELEESSKECLVQVTASRQDYSRY